MDVYTAARGIKNFISKSVIRITNPKGQIYEVISEASKAPVEKPPEFVALEPVLSEKGFIRSEDIRKALGVSLIQANRIACKLVALGWLEPKGEKAW